MSEAERDEPTAVTPIPANMAPIRLLVCSIGNPGSAYANTLHSAGHTVLNALSSSLSYPSFQNSKAYAGTVSEGSDFTLWQSPSYMNVSGTPVAKAWKQFVKEGRDAKLVVVHDELELPLGQVNVKNGSASPKGHNGLKSIKGTVGPNFMRIGVGIGRPESREPHAVASYVLRKMTPQERFQIEGCVGRVEMELRKLAG